jgi:hypothetical protein
MLSRRSVGAIVFFSIIVAISAVNAQISGTQRDLQSTKPYTPTRLEWLAVELNSSYRQEITSGCSIHFIPIHDEDTLLISVQYNPKLDREVLNSSLDTVRLLVKGNAKLRGWDSWLKLREEIKMAEK